MSLKEISSYKITTKLISDLSNANRHNVEPAEIPATPESITSREVFENKDGTWSENLIVEIKPLKTPLEIKSEYTKQVDGLVSDYKNFAISNDKEMYDYNELINQKKSLIISLISDAAGIGCTNEPSDAIVDGVVCGIGSTIYNDRVILNTYPNLDNFSSDNIFASSKTDLQSSNFGKGFENIISDNSGVNVGLYASITGFKDSNPSILDSTCVGYATSVLNLVIEIDSLRRLRNKNLTAVNAIKEDKTSTEIVRWGENRADNEMGGIKNNIKNALKNVSIFVDDIVYENLVIFLDSTKDYTIDSKLETSTGITKINTWTSLSSDSIVAKSSPESPTYDVVDGPSAWFNQYDVTGKYFNLNKSYIDDGYGIISGNVSYSLESWFKITNDSNLTSDINIGGASIVGVSSSKGIGMQIYKPNGIRLDFGSRGSGNLVSVSTLFPNLWYHAVCVREVGVDNRIYINGLLNNTSNISNLSVLSSSSTMRVGFSSSNYIQQYFPGKISVVRMYSKALSNNEVKKNFDAHKSRYGSLI